MAGSLRKPLLIVYASGFTVVALLLLAGSRIQSAPRLAGDPCGGASLSLDVTTDQPSYAAGQTVTMTATLHWGGTVACVLSPLQRATHWAVEARTDGSAVWDSFCDPSPLGHPTRPKECLISRDDHPTLQPGDDMSLTQTWTEQRDGHPAGSPQRAAPGDYDTTLVYADLSATAEFTLT